MHPPPLPGRRLTWTAFAGVALALLTWAGPALGAPCGGVDLRDGKVVTGRPLATDAPLTEETRTCLAAIGAALKAQAGLRAVTVALRLPGEARARPATRQVARDVADALVAAGLPDWRVSAVVPAARQGEPATLEIAYATRPAPRPVASLNALGGRVDLDLTTGSRAGRNGDLLRSGDAVRTGPGSYAVVALADGSSVRLAADSHVKLGRIALDAKLRRQVRIELVAGKVTSQVAYAGKGASFDVITRVATAGVRGTTFRVGEGADGATRLETLTGKVELSGSGGKVMVPAGRCAKVGSDGRPEPPHHLLPGPQVLGPLQGRVGRDATLRWRADAGAVRWQIEVAADAEFKLEARSWTSDRAQMALPAELRAGKWFWRVLAIDADDFVGLPSRVYALTVP